MRKRLRTRHAGRRLLPDFDQRVMDRSGEIDLTRSRRWFHPSGKAVDERLLEDRCTACLYLDVGDAPILLQKSFPLLIKIFLGRRRDF
jgi:hypothetical protein